MHVHVRGSIDQDMFDIKIYSLSVQASKDKNYEHFEHTCTCT